MVTGQIVDSNVINTNLIFTFYIDRVNPSSIYLINTKINRPDIKSNAFYIYSTTINYYDF